MLPPPLVSTEEVFRSCLERRRLTSISRSSRSAQEESKAIPWLGEVAQAGAATAARELDEGPVPPMPSGLRWSSSSEAATAAPEVGEEEAAAVVEEEGARRRPAGGGGCPAEGGRRVVGGAPFR